MTVVSRVLICAISIPIGALFLFWLWASYYFSPGRFNRELLNGVVDEARRRQIDSEKVVQFQIDNLAKPKGLRVVTDSRPRNVWVERREGGGLVVSIMTRDRGHFGEFGFAYADIPLRPYIVEGELRLNVPSAMNSAGRRIDDHWWEIINRTR